MKEAKEEKEKKETKEKKPKTKEEEEEEEDDAVRKKITDVVEEAMQKGERRLAFLNLAWTGPIGNTFLQDKMFDWQGREHGCRHVSPFLADGRGG